MSLRKPPPHEELPLFTTLFTSPSTKDSQELMEYPFLSLSKKRIQPIHFKTGDIEITVKGTDDGIATIWDWDLMLWLLSQIRSALDRKQSVSRKIRFNRSAFLKYARRSNGGKEYALLEASILRLQSTTVRTSIRVKRGVTVAFSWLESAEILRDDQGHLNDVVVVIPDWLFEAVCDHRLVLTLHPDYFLLKKGLERWLYRLIRKQAGNRPDGWRWPLRLLHERSGSVQPFKYFAHQLRSIIQTGHLLDYNLSLLSEGQDSSLIAVRRKPEQDTPTEVPPISSPQQPQQPDLIPEAPPSVRFLKLKPWTYERGRQIARGYDIYGLEADWHTLLQRHNRTPPDPDADFLEWCRVVATKAPLREGKAYQRLVKEVGEVGE